MILAREQMERIRSSELVIQLGGAAGIFASYVECARLARSDVSNVGAEEVYESPGVEPASRTRTGNKSGAVAHGPHACPNIAGALAITSGSLGKQAVDVINASRTEVGELSESAAFERGVSSAMPQKRNRVLSAMIRNSRPVAAVV